MSDLIATKPVGRTQALPTSWLDAKGTAAVVAGFVALAAFLSFELNAWSDEVYSLSTSSHGLAQAIRLALEFEVQPPLYFAALSLWRSVLGDSLFAARALSILVCAAALVVTTAWITRLTPNLKGWLAAAVVATHPTLLWAASEARVYGLVMLWSVVLTFGASLVYDHDQPSRKQRALFVAAATLSLYTQYYLGFLLAGLGVALLVRRRAAALRTFGLDMLVVGLLALPLFIEIASQVRAHDLGYDAPPSVARSVKILFGRFEGELVTGKALLRLLGIDTPPAKMGLWLLRAGLFGLVVRLGARFVRSRKAAGNVTVPGIAVAFFGLSMVLVLWRIGLSNVEERHTVGIILPLLAAAIGLISAATDKRFVVSAAVVLLAGNVSASTLKFRSLAKRCDCRRVATHLQAEERPGEPILVFFSEDSLPLKLHYTGMNRIVPVPMPPSLEHFTAKNFIIESPEQIQQALGAPESNPGALWVLTGPGKGAYQIDYGRDALETFLSQHYRLDRSVAFAEGTDLRRFERR